MLDPLTQQVKTLGKKYAEVKKQLDGFQLLTSPELGRSCLEKLDRIREELVEIKAAYRLDDGSLVIKSDLILSFLEPNFPHMAISKRPNPDLSDPNIVKQIALGCGLTQWLFLANQIVDPTSKEKFLKSCVQIVANETKK